MAVDLRSPRAWAFLLILVGLFVLMAGTAKPAAAQTEYRIGAGDQLGLLMWGVENDPLSNVDAQVRPDGKISYPILGEFAVVGMTPVELADKLGTALKTMYKDPKITVVIRKSASSNFSIAGEIRGPGSYEIITAISIKEAIAKAGGFAYSADTRTATLMHKDGTKVSVDLESILKGDSSKEIAIQPGDTIIIGTAYVTILGAVISSTTISLRDADTLSSLLARANGVQNERADIDGAYITRDGKKIPLELRKLLVDRDQTANVKLQAGDIVNVPFSQLRVTVYGGVTRPGTYELVPELKDHLMDAVSAAGGPQQDAILEKVKVVRAMPDGTRKTIMVNMRNAGPESNIKLQTGDYVSMGLKKQNPWSQISSIASLALSLLYLYKGVGK